MASVDITPVDPFFVAVKGEVAKQHCQSQGACEATDCRPSFEKKRCENKEFKPPFIGRREMQASSQAAVFGSENPRTSGAGFNFAGARFTAKHAERAALAASPKYRGGLASYVCALEMLFWSGIIF